MEDLSRRSFFKLVAAASAVAAMPSVLRLVPESEPGLALGMIRELTAYNVYDDRIGVRHDIRTATVQLGVDHWIDSAADLVAARQQSIDSLTSAMAKEGIRVSDLLEMKEPVGWKNFW